MNREQIQETHRVAALIIGFIRNDLREEQRVELDEWIARSDDNRQLFERLTDKDRIEESREWFEQVDQQTAMYNVRLRINEQTTRRKIFYRVAAAAAIIILAGVSTYTFYLRHKQNGAIQAVPLANKDSSTISPHQIVLVTGNGQKIILEGQDRQIPIGNNVSVREDVQGLVYRQSVQAVQHTIQVPLQRKYKLTLADGTTVWLNAQSTLQYPSSFNDSTRTVQLQGEAYFEIAANKNLPFIVACGNTRIRVLGTLFNVNAYPQSAHQQISLVEGGISVLSGDQQKQLKANQQVIVSGSAMQVNAVPDANDFTEWTKGLFYFQHSSIGEVLQQLAQWYGVESRAEGNIDKQFTGTFPRSVSLAEALQMLQKTSKVQFILDGRQIIARP